VRRSRYCCPQLAPPSIWHGSTQPDVTHVRCGAAPRLTRYRTKADALEKELGLGRTPTGGRAGGADGSATAADQEELRTLQQVQGALRPASLRVRVKIMGLIIMRTG
jgi:hypothetical protein